MAERDIQEKINRDGGEAMIPIHRPRVTGQILTEELGRLVADVDMDSAEQVLTFRVPSYSRRHRVYVVEIDLLSTEVGCGCEALSRYGQGEDDREGFREARKMPYRFDNAASSLEAMAAGLGFRMLPSILRAPRGLCPHARKARLWLQRHRHFRYFELRGEKLMDKFARMTPASDPGDTGEVMDIEIPQETWDALVADMRLALGRYTAIQADDDTLKFASHDATDVALKYLREAHSRVTQEDVRKLRGALRACAVLFQNCEFRGTRIDLIVTEALRSTEGNEVGK